MKICKNKVVTIDYQLHDQHGNLLDSSKENGQLSYIQGLGHIIPGLEKAIEGHAVGDQIKVVVNPEEGYGVRDESLIMTVRKEEFEQGASLKVGLQIEADTDEGPAIFTIVEIKGEEVTIDGNHPLADQKLHFEVTVQEVRDASAEELDHGHIH